MKKPHPKDNAPSDAVFEFSEGTVFEFSRWDSRVLFEAVSVHFVVLGAKQIKSF